MTSNLIYSKDSFERFGDDLCELLLSYLTISDKFCYECVCKQWQQFIYNKEFELTISSNIKSKSDHNIHLLCFDNDIGYYINVKRMETILKKCKYIKKLEINEKEFSIDNKYYGLVADGCLLDIISQNCQYLETFIFVINTRFSDSLNDCYFDNKSEVFFKKCGQKLKSIEIKGISSEQMVKLLGNTPNVRKVYFNDISVFIDSKDAKFFTKLEEIKVSQLCHKDLKSFTDRYHKKLKKIDIKFKFNYILKSDSIEELNESLIQLSRFENLEELKISIKFRNTCQVTNGLQMIANKCTKLKVFKFETKSKKIVLNEELIPTFCNLKSLKCLSLKIREMNKILSTSNHFSEMLNLSELMITYTQISDDLFNEIDLYLPNLHSIQFNCVSITDQTLKHLTKLPKLSSVKLESIKVTEEGVCHLIKHCLNLRVFYWTGSGIYKNTITDNIIKSCIESAQRKPKLIHKFLFPGNLQIIHELPPNLLIGI